VRLFGQSFSLPLASNRNAGQDRPTLQSKERVNAMSILDLQTVKLIPPAKGTKSGVRTGANSNLSVLLCGGPPPP
jgi:SapB morphogen precursor RamS